MANIQLLEVGRTRKQSVQNLNKWTIPCLDFVHFGGGIVVGL